MLLLDFNWECAALTITGHNDFSDSVTQEEISVMERIYSSWSPVWEGFSLFSSLLCVCGEDVDEVVDVCWEGSV